MGSERVKKCEYVKTKSFFNNLFHESQSRKKKREAHVQRLRAKKGRERGKGKIGGENTDARDVIDGRLSARTVRGPSSKATTRWQKRRDDDDCEGG
jgi:hypothetical protein